jgi:HSP20 family molecular chaperone IbpA
MIRKIKPVSRIIKISTEIDRIKRAPVSQAGRVLDLDENWIPRVDVYEKPREIIVEAEIPGVAQADIIITVQSSRVEIRGMKKDQIPSQKIHYLRLEREFGSFRRLLGLPATVLPDRAKAFLQNGVLTLRLKKFIPEEDRESVVVIRKDEE